MEDKNKQQGEPAPEEQAAAEKSDRLGGSDPQEPAGEEDREIRQPSPEQAGEAVQGESSEEAALEAEHRPDDKAEVDNGPAAGGADDERAFDTMELKLFDKLDTERAKEPAADAGSAEKEEEPAKHQPDAAEKQAEQPAETLEAADREEGASAATSPAPEEAERGKPAESAEKSGSDSVTDEQAGETEAGLPVDTEPKQEETGEEHQTEEAPSPPKAEETGTTEESGEPAGEVPEKDPETASAVDQDTGVLTAIRKEIQNTPKPKKILVGTIASAMIIVGAVGLSTYAVQSGSPGSGPGIRVEAEQPKAQPAKLQLYLEDKRFELDLYSIGYNGKDLATVDQMKLRAWLDQVKKQVDREPKNAFKKRIGDPVTPERPGRKMDVRTVAAWLKDLKPFINKPTEIPMVPVQPAVTVADLKKVGSRLIGKYTTRFDPGNVNRTTNIKLASKAIDGLILMPGETFSFNRVVGPRTAARGYKPAKVIVKGEYSEGIGGGICQVSSTLFNSVDEAGLKIIRRSSHSKEVTYVPPGRDATVSWGGPDFRFKNNLTMPVLIRIKVSGPYITVYTYTAPGAKVARKKVPQAPESFTTITVDPDKPTENLPKTGQ